jgi:hypothetical protein
MVSLNYLTYYSRHSVSPCDETEWTNSTISQYDPTPTTTYTSSYLKGTVSTATYNNPYYYTHEDLKKQKEIIKKQLLAELKALWTETKNEYKKILIKEPLPKVKNICLNGRGWR